MSAALAEVNWYQLMNDLSTESMLELLCKESLLVCERFVAVRRNRSKRKIIPRDGRVLIRRKTRLANRITAIYDANLKRRLIASHEKEKRYADLKAVESVKRNPKFFYKYAHEKAKIRCPIGPLNVDGEMVGDPEWICEILWSQYDSVFN